MLRYISKNVALLQILFDLIQNKKQNYNTLRIFFRDDKKFSRFAELGKLFTKLCFLNSGKRFTKLCFLNSEKDLQSYVF